MKGAEGEEYFGGGCWLPSHCHHEIREAADLLRVRKRSKRFFYPLTKRTSLLSSKWVAAFFGKESDKNCEDIKSEIIFF